jgi:hypothetical protein
MSVGFGGVRSPRSASYAAATAAVRAGVGADEELLVDEQTGEMGKGGDELSAEESQRPAMLGTTWGARPPATLALDSDVPTEISPPERVPESSMTTPTAAATATTSTNRHISRPVAYQGQVLLPFDPTLLAHVPATAPPRARPTAAAAAGFGAAKFRPQSSHAGAAATPTAAAITAAATTPRTYSGQTPPPRGSTVPATERPRTPGTTPKFRRPPTASPKFRPPTSTRATGILTPRARTHHMDHNDYRDHQTDDLLPTADSIRQALLATMDGPPSLSGSPSSSEPPSSSGPFSSSEPLRPSSSSRPASTRGTPSSDPEAVFQRLSRPPRKSPLPPTSMAAGGAGKWTGPDGTVRFSRSALRPICLAFCTFYILFSPLHYFSWFVS